MAARKRSPEERPEHETNRQPSNREKHERGSRRKRMGQGREKKRRKPNAINFAPSPTLSPAS